MAKAKKAPLRKGKMKYLVYVSIKRRLFCKMPAAKQITLLDLADEKNDPSADLVSLTFTRQKWFHVCGEVYALLVANVPFTLNAVSVEVSKGGAK